MKFLMTFLMGIMLVTSANALTIPDMHVYSDGKVVLFYETESAKTNLERKGVHISGKWIAIQTEISVITFEAREFRGKSLEGIKGLITAKIIEQLTGIDGIAKEIMSSFEDKTEEIDLNDFIKAELLEILTKDIEAATKAIEKTEEQIEKITESVEKVTESVEEVSEVAEEVSEVVEEVAEAVEEVAEVVEEAAEVVEEVAEVVEEVAEVVEEVVDVAEAAADKIIKDPNAKPDNHENGCGVTCGDYGQVNSTDTHGSLNNGAHINIGGSDVVHVDGQNEPFAGGNQDVGPAGNGVNHDLGSDDGDFEENGCGCDD